MIKKVLLLTGVAAFVLALSAPSQSSKQAQFIPPEPSTISTSVPTL